MSKVRIAPLPPPYSSEVQQDFDRIMHGAPPLALFRTVARNPRVLSRMMAGGLLDRGSITIRARELMILRTCARCGAEYEWGVHVAVYSAKAKLSPAQVNATAAAQINAADWPIEDLLVLRLADALHDSSRVEDALWAELSACYDETQLIELLMLAGLYHAVSFVVNGTGVEREAFAPKFPTTRPD